MKKIIITFLIATLSLMAGSTNSTTLPETRVGKLIVMSVDDWVSFFKEALTKNDESAIKDAEIALNKLDKEKAENIAMIVNNPSTFDGLEKIMTIIVERGKYKIIFDYDNLNKNDYLKINTITKGTGSISSRESKE